MNENDYDVLLRRELADFVLGWPDWQCRDCGLHWSERDEGLCPECDSAMVERDPEE